MATRDIPGAIQTASVAELAETTFDAVLAEIQQRVHRFNWFKLYCWVVALLLVVSLGEPSAALALLVLCGVAGYFLYNWDKDRRTARLIYDIDDEPLVQRLALCNAAGEALSQSAVFWHIYSSLASRDAKRNAGASTLVQRTTIRASPGALPGIELNIEPWSVPVGPQQLLFLPDYLLVHEHSKFAAVPYDQLNADFETTSFVEEAVVPPDSKQVGVTWRFVNKAGGPDRRFNNNRQLPILAYGELALRSASGMHIVLQVSNPAAGRRAQEALLELGRLARCAPAPSAYATRAPAEVKPTESVAGQRPSPSPDASISPIVGVLLRYVAAADGKISANEVQYVAQALGQLDVDFPASEFMRQFRRLKSNRTEAEAAAQLLRRERPDLAPTVVRVATSLAAADGRVTPKEEERLAEIAAWLSAS